MSAPEYLWQADSAVAGGRGVCGKPELAMAKAEGCLRGGAARALVEEVTPGVAAVGMDDGWCPTGKAWFAELVDGGVVWVPAAVA